MWSIDENANKPHGTDRCDWHAWIVHRLHPKGRGFFMALQFPSNGVTEDAAQALVRRVVDGLNREEDELRNGKTEDQADGAEVPKATTQEACDERASVQSMDD